MMRISKSPQERKAEIIEAALALFLENGYEGTSVSMIVSRVGVAQGLFYYYFKSKEDIFEAAMEFYTDRLAEEIISDLLSAEPRSVSDRLTRVLIALKNMVQHSEGPLTNGMSARESSDIDMRFSYYMSQNLIEPVTLLLQLVADQSHTHIAAPELLASFIVFGIHGLIHGLTYTHHNTKALDPELILPIFSGITGIPADVLNDLKITVPEEVLS
jgi:AcrR family transcriptional regulator